MSREIKVLGLASQKEFTLQVSQSDLLKGLMHFLQKKGLPIASSCSGEGICQKCVVNENLLSCQIKVEEFLDKKSKVEIAYL